MLNNLFCICFCRRVALTGKLGKSLTEIPDWATLGMLRLGKSTTSVYSNSYSTIRAILILFVVAIQSGTSDDHGVAVIRSRMLHVSLPSERDDMLSIQH